MTDKQEIIFLNQYQCKRCQHTWYPRTPNLPVVCPKCKNPRWNKEVNNGNRADRTADKT